MDGGPRLQHQRRLWAASLPCIVCLLLFGGRTLFINAVAGMVLAHAFEVLGAGGNAAALVVQLCTLAMSFAICVSSMMPLLRASTWLGLLVIGSAGGFFSCMGLWMALSCSWFVDELLDACAISERLLFTLLPIPAAVLSAWLACSVSSLGPGGSVVDLGWRVVLSCTATHVLLLLPLPSSFCGRHGARRSSRGGQPSAGAAVVRGAHLRVLVLASLALPACIACALAPAGSTTLSACARAAFPLLAAWAFQPRGAFGASLLGAPPPAVEEVAEDAAQYNLQRRPSLFAVAGTCAAAITLAAAVAPLLVAATTATAGIGSVASWVALRLDVLLCILALFVLVSGAPGSWHAPAGLDAPAGPPVPAPAPAGPAASRLGDFAARVLGALALGCEAAAISLQSSAAIGVTPCGGYPPALVLASSAALGAGARRLPEMGLATPRTAWLLGAAALSKLAVLVGGRERAVVLPFAIWGAAWASTAPFRAPPGRAPGDGRWASFWHSCCAVTLALCAATLLCSVASGAPAPVFTGVTMLLFGAWLSMLARRASAAQAELRWGRLAVLVTVAGAFRLVFSFGALDARAAVEAAALAVSGADRAGDVALCSHASWSLWPLRVAQFLASAALCGAVPLHSPSAVLTFATAFGTFAGLHLLGRAQLQPGPLSFLLFAAACSSGAALALLPLTRCGRSRQLLSWTCAVFLALCPAALVLIGLFLDSRRHARCHGSSQGEAQVAASNLLACYAVFGTAAALSLARASAGFARPLRKASASAGFAAAAFWGYVHTGSAFAVFAAAPIAFLIPSRAGRERPATALVLVAVATACAVMAIYELLVSRCTVLRCALLALPMPGLVGSAQMLLGRRGRTQAFLLAVLPPNAVAIVAGSSATRVLGVIAVCGSGLAAVALQSRAEVSRRRFF